jgi:multicomponent Na+:H+ antiporter subunit B
LKFIGLVIVCLTGGLLLYGTVDLPDWGDPGSPASTHLSDYYIEHILEQTQVPNLVTAVLADFRGYDTMFETAVVFCAGLACFLLLRDFRPKKDRYYRHVPTGVMLHVKNPDTRLIMGNEFEHMDREWVPSDMIIKTVCRILIPFIQIYALYVVAHGDFSPGGGFQGGVIFGSSLILMAIAYNLKTLVSRVTEKFLSHLCRCRCVDLCRHRGGGHAHGRPFSGLRHAGAAFAFRSRPYPGFGHAGCGNRCGHCRDGGDGDHLCQYRV